MSDASLLAGFAANIGADAVQRDDAALALAASDAHIAGARPSGQATL